MIYYIADTHFRDQAIFDKCKRPFKTLKEMEDHDGILETSID